MPSNRDHRASYGGWCGYGQKASATYEHKICHKGDRRMGRVGGRTGCAYMRRMGRVHARCVVCAHVRRLRGDRSVGCERVSLCSIVRARSRCVSAKLLHRNGQRPRAVDEQRQQRAMSHHAPELLRYQHGGNHILDACGRSCADRISRFGKHVAPEPQGWHAPYPLATG